MATGQPPIYHPKHTWTLDQRTALHLLRKPPSTLDTNTVVRIFNHMFADQFKEYDFPQGLSPSVIRDDYNSRHHAGRSKAYEQIDTLNKSDEQVQREARMQIAVDGACRDLGLVRGNPAIAGPAPPMTSAATAAHPPSAANPPHLAQEPAPNLAPISTAPTPEDWQVAIDGIAAALAAVLNISDATAITTRAIIGSNAAMDNATPAARAIFDSALERARATLLPGAPTAPGLNPETIVDGRASRSAQPLQEFNEGTSWGQLRIVNQSDTSNPLGGDGHFAGSNHSSGGDQSSQSRQNRRDSYSGSWGGLHGGLG